MDFQAAEIRLKNDHNKLRSRTRNRNAARTLASSAAATKAKKAEEYRKKQMEKKKRKEQIERKKLEYVKNGFGEIERRLGVVRELNGAGTESVELEAVSVHGLGDKITLPTSILSALAERDLLQLNQERGQPLFFRIGIRREGYVFPQSEAMKNIMDVYAKKVDANAPIIQNEASKETNTREADDDDDDVMMTDENDETKEMWMKAYLEELSYQYISYTYATVVEFSQDEGFIGLPHGISDALINPKGLATVKSKLTVDPALQNKEANATGMEIDSGKNEQEPEEHLEEKTPGHAAYGLFPIPILPIEVTLLTHLPLGEKCTLQPNEAAIKNGFYNLKNVKLALEQSLIRTRGSLNEGDLMHCWFRGKKFDLSVQNVFPSDVGAISCVNCDIEVDIAPPASSNSSDKSGADTTNENEANKVISNSLSGGYKLSDSPSEKGAGFPDTLSKRKIELAPEPLDGETDIIVVQVRGRGKTSRRKFLLSSPLKQLFDFVIAEGMVADTNSFKVVTRFPRRVYEIGSGDEQSSFQELGMSKQEAFIVET
jgi:hypothetical protein